MTRKAIRIAARLYAGATLLGSQPSFMFEDSELSDGELEALEGEIQTLAHRLLRGLPLLSLPVEIIAHAKSV